MSVPIIKALTRRFRERVGSNEVAARLAGVSPGVWSGYENADKEETTIPLGRLARLPLIASERREIIDLFTVEEDQGAADIRDEAGEATEAAARVQGIVRLETRDGRPVSEAAKRRIRAAALEAKAEMDDVLQVVGQ